MHRYSVKHTELLGADTLLLTLQPQRQKDTLRFYPGQYAAISFKRGGRPTPMRCFSMVSTPNDVNSLQFAMRVDGDFTGTAAQLEIGSEVFVRGPFGNFVIDPEVDESVILLAGGIGITPLMSMARYTAETKHALPITLLYSCKSQDDVPFFDELVWLERQNPHFKVIFFITRGSIDKLNHPRVVTGYIDEPRLNQITAGNYARFTYFICGPKGFMQRIESALRASGADPERIITEAFTQSSKSKSFALLPRSSISKLTYALTTIALIGGTGLIMALDLARSVPKIVQAAAKTSTSQTTTASTTNITQQSSESTAPTTSTNDTSGKVSTPNPTSTTTQQPQTTQTDVQPTQTYQVPTTSVS